MNLTRDYAPNATSFLRVSPSCTCGQPSFCHACADRAAESLGRALDRRASQSPSRAVLDLADAYAAGYALGAQGIAAAPPEALDGLAFGAYDWGVQEGLRDHAAQQAAAQLETINAANALAADAELAARLDWEAEDEARQADREEFDADYRAWLDAIEADREDGWDWHEDEVRQAGHNPAWTSGGAA